MRISGSLALGAIALRSRRWLVVSSWFLTLSRRLIILVFCETGVPRGRSCPVKIPGFLQKMANNRRHEWTSGVVTNEQEYHFVVRVATAAHPDGIETQNMAASRAPVDADQPPLLALGLP